jgi:hypothetical protein
MGIVITGGGSLSPLLRVAFFIFAAMGANAIRAGCLGSIALLFAVAFLDGGFLFGAASGGRDGDRGISSFSAYASLGAIDATETSRPGRFDRDLDLEP